MGSSDYGKSAHKASTLNRDRPDAAADESPPPLLRSWRNLYVLLLGELGILVLLFYALTRWAA